LVRQENRQPLTLGNMRPDGWYISGRGQSMKVALRVALGMVCFGIGAADLIGAICMLAFSLVFEAAVTGMFGAMFLWISFLLLRRLRWHND